MQRPDAWRGVQGRRREKKYVKTLVKCKGGKKPAAGMGVTATTVLTMLMLWSAELLAVRSIAGFVSHERIPPDWPLLVFNAIAFGGVLLGLSSAHPASFADVGLFAGGLLIPLLSASTYYCWPVPPKPQHDDPAADAAVVPPPPSEP